MPITLTLSNETPDDMLADLRRLFPSILAGRSVEPAPVAEPAVKNDTALPTEMFEGVVTAPEKPEPAPRKPRASKKDQAESTGTTAAASSEPGTESPLSDASSAETTASASTSSEPEKSEASASDASSEEVPDLDAVRAKLKTLGATDGLGHDKVFEVLGHYKAKNASGVAEGDRAKLIAEIDALLKDAA